MREYHIYIQHTKCVEGHFKWITYKWLPWEYVGYVEGTKELYTYFKSKFPYSINSIDFYNSFNYFDDEYLKIDNNWDFMICTHEYHRYLIMDDYGNVRDFHQLTKKYKKKYYRTYRKHHGRIGQTVSAVLITKTYDNGNVKQYINCLGGL